MAQMTSATGSLPLRLSKGETLVIKDLAGSHTVTGSLAPREDATASVGAGFVVYGPQSSEVTVTISTTGAVDYQVVSGDVTTATPEARTKYPNFPTGEAIQAAIDAAFAAGGGDVQLDYITYTLTQAIQLREGVRLVGSGYQVTNYHDPDYVSGTRLLGNGTFNLVECNATDSATPMTPGTGNAVNTFMVMKTGCVNMALDGGIYGLKVGGLNQVGAGYSDFHDLLLLRNSSHAALFENCGRLNLHHLTCYFGKHGVWYGTSSNGVWNWGNQRIDSIVGGMNSGISFRLFARNGSDLNNVVCRDVGISGGTASHPEINHTVTVGGGTLTVSDLSKFEPGIGVLCLTGANAFFANRTYYVLTRSAATGAGTITVALKPGGAEIVPTGSGSVTFKTRGWQILEMMGEGATGKLTYCSLMDATDVEVGGAPKVSLGGLRGCLVQLGIFGGQDPSIAMRDVDYQSTLITQQSAVIDSDSRWNHVGAPVTALWSLPGSGMWTVPNGRGFVSLGEGSIDCRGDAFNRVKISKHFTGVQEITNGQTLAGNTERNLTYVTDTAGGAFTLQSSVSDNMIGMEYGVFNATANAVTMNYNATAGAQIAGKGLAPANSFSIPAWTDMQIRLVKKGSTFYWAVL